MNAYPTHVRVDAPLPIEIEGVRVNPFTVATLHDYIGSTISRGCRARVLNVNVHAMNLVHRHPAVAACFRSAEAVFCDGAGVRLGARLLGKSLPVRITYADWMWKLAHWAAANDRSLFFLGAGPGIAELASRRLRAEFPALRVVGTEHGYFRRGGDEESALVRRIAESGADILIVAFGMPAQELWLDRWWSSLGVAIGLTGGACFDYVSGTVARCPKWMRDSGLEWLFRLVQQPRRLGSRYLIGLPWFFGRILLQRLRRG